MIKNIGIVGAGFAGLTAARVFKALGYQVTVYDKEEEVGGVWTSSRRYPGLTTQNTRETYELSDYPMPNHYPEWPSGEQVQQYMQGYAEHFNFIEDIVLSTEVVNASFDDNAKTWAVTTRKIGEEATKTETFDYLIVGNGIFSIPSIPQYEGVEDFVQAGGRICHTSEFNNKEDAAGKNVLIIGYGKSSCDVAYAINDVTQSTTVVARNLIWKIPKFIANRLNYKHLFLTRMSEALFRYIRLEGMDKFFHTIGNPIRKAMLGSVERIVAKQLKLKEIDLHPGKPLETIASSTVSLVTPGFYEAVKAGELTVKANNEIVKLAPGKATLKSGEVVDVDLIICGTGWHQRCQFLDDEVMSKVTDETGNFRLYRSMLPVGVERLAFNGYNSSFFSQLNCEVGALWLADYLNGGITLPDTEEQHKEIDERLDWMEKRTNGKHAKGTNIIPFSIHHIDELLGDMKMNVSRGVRFKQWLGALQPKVYRHILPKLQSKYSQSE